jgi:eukaryotic-like serine/threonine-protein kinase
VPNGFGKATWYRPRSLTRYELMERIGVGAVAEIFRGKAIAVGGFEKPVAIKRILPELGQDRRFVEALMAEAKILSQLRHRNIVQIFDVGLGDDGQYFLVMEYVDGMDLGEIQRTLEGRRRRLPLDLALHLGAEICEALEHAHTALAPDGQPMRLVHRDVAPTNVLVSRHGEVKLTDFGLARRPEDVTGHGARGRFGYQSPEAAAGGAIDPRSDVFSVAVIVYELTLGRRLYSHLPDLEAIRAIRQAEVPRPREVDPGLPAALDEILASALVNDPARRIPSAGALGAKLRSLRYSFDTAAGDPAQELGRVVLGVEQAVDGPGTEVPTDARRAAGRRRRNPASSQPSGTSPGEPTVVSLTSLDVFADDRDGTGLIRARAILDKFEEEETRLAGGPGPGSQAAGRWRDPVRETAPTGVYVADGLDGDPEESTNVLSPAHLARRVGDARVVDGIDDATRQIKPRAVAGPASPPRLPAIPRARPMPPPVPPPPPPVPVRVEAKVPARTATPTVADPPGLRPEPRQTSRPPVVAGFDGAGSRRWLVIVAIAVAVIAAGLTIAVLR